MLVDGRLLWILKFSVDRAGKHILLSRKTKGLWVPVNISKSNIIFGEFYLTSLVLSLYHCSHTESEKILDSSVYLIAYLHCPGIYIKWFPK